MLHANIKNAVEYRGLEADQILKELHEDAEWKLAAERDEREGFIEDEISIPSEIQLMAQALAYRDATPEDLEPIYKLLNKASNPKYMARKPFVEMKKR